ncbi:MAG: hypothetical protein LLG15_03570 [Betaproteobacteria bacterium]|nr:hypothetical protein [Betaproteobacteria bacterium]
MQKFDFSLRTRDGQKVDHILIAGKDQQDAERKLNQMYRNCQVMRCESKCTAEKRSPAMYIEDILNLITK